MAQRARLFATEQQVLQAFLLQHYAGQSPPALLLLIRLVQGFSASGEYAGAAAFLAEYAPPGRRGLYTSIVPASTQSVVTATSSSHIRGNCPMTI